METPPPLFDPQDDGDTHTRLFVYGTLKRGQMNHGRLEQARWLGESTLEGASLFDLGPFPMAILGEGSVEGEVYAVTWRDLEDLDAFEGCPRLYQRHWVRLVDNRHAWVYLGLPRQVRHVKRLPDGRWPAAAPVAHKWEMGPIAMAFSFLSTLNAGVGLASGFDTLGACQAWRSSRGVARIELANSIGAAHYLTKRHPFAESTAGAPVDLYSPADIQRVCGRL